MTEKQWLACCEPQKMLESLGDKASDRKLRLFACCCIRQHPLWEHATDERVRGAIQLLEDYVDSPRDGMVGEAFIDALQTQ